MKAIIKNVEITEENRAKVEFAESIDFEPLWEALRAKVGKKDIAFETPEIQGSRHNAQTVTIDWQSENLKDEVGIMSIAYKDLRLCKFGGEVFFANSSADNPGELVYWCTVHWGFEYADGGSNGSQIGRARYSVADGWQIEL